MALQRFTVEVQPDFIERQAKARPIDALAEIIWNGLDAYADRVDVRLSQGEFGLFGITVADNGYGIPYADAPGLFTRLGGSWKQWRRLHPHEAPDAPQLRGQGPVLGLRARARWEVRITDEQPASDGRNTGVELTVTELHRDFRSLEPETSIQEL